MPKPILSSIQIAQKYKMLAANRRMSPQKRGYELEHLLYSVLHNENLEPSVAYKIKGEQIDGSFFWMGQTFLIEAKWNKSKLSASTLFTFKGKVDGKFHTTNGIFLAINGYSKNAADSLKFGKNLNILLFDGEDAEIIFNGDTSFLDVLKFKLRAAGDTGSVMAPYKLLKTAAAIEHLPFRKVSKITDKNLSLVEPHGNLGGFLVFVQGEHNLLFGKNLIESFKSSYSFSYKLTALDAAFDIQSLPPLINEINNYRPTQVVLLLERITHTEEVENVTIDVRKQFIESAIPVESKFLYFDQNLKKRILASAKSNNTIHEEAIVKSLENFLFRTPEDYVDDTFDRVNAELEGFDWDEGDHTINGESEMGTTFSLSNIEELIEFLDEEIVQIQQSDLPLEMLKELGHLDFQDEIKECLSADWLPKLKELGWDTSDLEAL